MSEREIEDLRVVPEVSGQKVVVALRLVEDIRPCYASSTRETAFANRREATIPTGQLETAEMRWM